MHIEASGASPLERKNCTVGKMEGINLFRKISLLFTYMRYREEAGIVGYDGHLCAITARLVKHPFHELHKYIRILFKSGVKVPVVILWLWGGAMDPLGNLPPFLLQMDELMFIKSNSGSRLSSIGIGTHPARRTVHGKSISTFNTSELLFLPFVQFGQNFGQSGGGVRTLPTAG